MIAYLDASVVLRLVLGEPNKLAEWKQVEGAVASALTEVECLRTLDRLGRAGALADKEVAARREEVYRLLEAVEVVDIARPILRRASEHSRFRSARSTLFISPRRSPGATRAPPTS